MDKYLLHMKDLGNPQAFVRRVSYLQYNYRTYINHVVAKKGKVLDIGPGFGELLKVLNQNGVTNIDIIDNDTSVLTHCRNNYQISQAFKTKGGAPGLYLKHTYDLITLTQVFEHIKKHSYQAWLSGLYNHLNPGGYLVITVPNGANPLVGTERYGDLQHENIFTVYSFRELMTFAHLPNASYVIRGFEIPPNSLINIIRIILQKILHGIFILLMIINGAIYQTLMTPNITLVIRRGKS